MFKDGLLYMQSVLNSVLSCINLHFDFETLRPNNFKYSLVLIFQPRTSILFEHSRNYMYLTQTSSVVVRISYTISGFCSLRFTFSAYLCTLFVCDQFKCLVHIVINCSCTNLVTYANTSCFPVLSCLRNCFHLYLNIPMMTYVKSSIAMHVTLVLFWRNGFAELH